MTARRAAPASATAETDARGSIAAPTRSSADSDDRAAVRA